MGVINANFKKKNGIPSRKKKKTLNIANTVIHKTAP
jgi:hypothetical protein